ncbi:hypothetical protein HMPREF0971_01678 [Segatella oris F0302]|uniref:Uncharacterized protein n=1 Tax=Segatella oris F0302 TaxID=649760 RepID=D1QRS2_9BACT|nr:hypothetical protein HMPREF0971_01678 [Segatella oris F0302]
MDDIKLRFQKNDEISMDISTYKNPRIKTKEILFLKTDFVKKHLKKTEILKREIEKSRTRKQRNKD